MDDVTEPDPAPTVLSGIWYSDGWISPFIKLRCTRIDDAATHLRLELFRPATMPLIGPTQEVVVRAGTTRLASHVFTSPENSFENILLPLPVDRAAADGFTVSIRSSRSLRAPGPDNRRLGLLLISLESVCHV